MNNNNARNYNKIYKKAKKINTEKCIFFHEEHLREITWEVRDQELNIEQNWILTIYYYYLIS